MNELSVQRRLTAQFIKRAPVDVELQTVAVQRTQDGGSRQQPVGDPRPAQRMTMIEPATSGYGLTTSNVQGTRTAIDYMLLGEWDADVRERDRFSVGGHDFEVVNVLPDNDFEVRAYVVRVR